MKYHRRQNDIQFKEPANYGWIEIKLTDYLINHIWDCVNDAGDNIKHTLVGHIDKSLAIVDKDQILWDNLLCNLVDAYGNKWTHNHYNIPIKTDNNNYTFYLDQMWVNYKNQYEFNPIHNHGGCYSFACWLKIPTDYHEQNQIYNAKDSSGRLNSAFCFHYIDSLGDLRTSVYQQSPKMEGTLLFFPSRLHHEVHPYYECDEQRISISGNIWLKDINK